MNKSIIVALDLTDHDLTLIKFAQQVQSTYQIAKVHFVHNIKISELDEILSDMMEDRQIGPMISKNLENKIKSIFKESDSYDLTLLEGDNTEFGISEWVKKMNKPTTALLGWKTVENGTGAMAQKLIRIFQGDVLLIPRDTSFKMQSILIPTDLSSNFSKVKNKVEELLPTGSPFQVSIIKSFNIPSVFFPFIDDQETKVKAEKLIMVQYEALNKKLKISDTWSFKAVYQNGKSISDIILRENKNCRADMLVMAAKGASTIATIFLGSTTNEIINRDPFQVLYIVK